MPRSVSLYIDQSVCRTVFIASLDVLYVPPPLLDLVNLTFAIEEGGGRRLFARLLMTASVSANVNSNVVCL